MGAKLRAALVGVEVAMGILLVLTTVLIVKLIS
jgi:hypothetical protein